MKIKKVLLCFSVFSSSCFFVSCGAVSQNNSSDVCVEVGSSGEAVNVGLNENVSEPLVALSCPVEKSDIHYIANTGIDKKLREKVVICSKVKELLNSFRKRKTLRLIFKNEEDDHIEGGCVKYDKPIKGGLCTKFLCARFIENFLLDRYEKNFLAGDKNRSKPFLKFEPVPWFVNSPSYSDIFRAKFGRFDPFFARNIVFNFSDWQDLDDKFLDDFKNFIDDLVKGGFANEGEVSNFLNYAKKNLADSISFLSNAVLKLKSEGFPEYVNCKDNMYSFVKEDDMDLTRYRTSIFGDYELGDVRHNSYKQTLKRVDSELFSLVEDRKKDAAFIAEYNKCRVDTFEKMLNKDIEERRLALGEIEKVTARDVLDCLEGFRFGSKFKVFGLGYGDLTGIYKDSAGELNFNKEKYAQLEYLHEVYSIFKLGFLDDYSFAGNLYIYDPINFIKALKLPVEDLKNMLEKYEARLNQFNRRIYGYVYGDELNKDCCLKGLDFFNSFGINWKELCKGEPNIGHFKYASRLLFVVGASLYKEEEIYLHAMIEGLKGMLPKE